MNDAFSSAMQVLIDNLRQTLGDDLIAVVLFGSAAENRRRAVSDTNLAVVVKRFDAQRTAACREVVALSRVALRLRLLLLRSDEVSAASSAFAVKFADIQRRRKVLYGSDPFADLQIPRSAAIAQLQQALLNLVLRLRDQWLGARDDHQLGLAAAYAAGGARVCAAELLALEGKPAENARAALDTIAGGGFAELSLAREGKLPPGSGDRVLARLMELAETMRARALVLR